MPGAGYSGAYALGDGSYQRFGEWRVRPQTPIFIRNRRIDDSTAITGATQRTLERT
jgi:hypothetical protein